MLKLIVHGANCKSVIDWGCKLQLALFLMDSLAVSNNSSLGFNTASNNSG